MFRTAVILVFGFIVAACAQPAYVYHAAEFNRSSATFGQDPTDISAVTVCYSSRGSTPAQVLELARKECGKFGKSAQFTGQNYTSCPLQAPVSANFSCLGEQSGRALGINNSKTPATAGHQVNYDGILFSY